MKNLLTALAISVAAMGAAHAGEIGYVHNPADNPAAQATASRADVQRDLAAHRAEVQAFNGEIDPTIDNIHLGRATRAQVQQDLYAQSRQGDDSNVEFVNG